MLRGVVYTPGVCTEGVFPQHTFGLIVYLPAWVFYSVRSIEMASDGQNGGRAKVDTPLFYMSELKPKNNPLTHGYQSE